jgi:hypothetical protein
MIGRLAILAACGLCTGHVQAQEDLSTRRWFSVNTANFQILSQRSRAQTDRHAMALEQWRTAATRILGETAVISPDPLPNHVYLFDREEDFRAFAGDTELSFLYSSPRSNFVILMDSDASLNLAQHHYAHFLVNNRPIGVPRWYEEGMSNYLSRLHADEGEITLAPFMPEQYELMVTVNNALSLEALLYDDAALASPRLIQVANLKSAMFMHFLLHAQEYEGFTDRRAHLQRYLDFLQQGRTERFAYDQSFDSSVSVLEREFDRFLGMMAESREDERQLFELAEEPVPEAQEADPQRVALQLGELALHAGQFDLSGAYFDGLMSSASPLGRAWSGFADARRMRERGEGEPAPDVESLYLQAQSVQADDYQLYLDYGQYLDTELKDCEAGYSEQERERMLRVMQEQFARALALNPDSPEVQLSYAQLFTRPGAAWQQGLPYHQQALKRLAADSFVLEQAIDYAILEDRLEYAARLVTRMARPMHFWGAHPWITALNNKLQAAQRGETYDACAAAEL